MRAREVNGFNSVQGHHRIPCPGVRTVNLTREGVLRADHGTQILRGAHLEVEREESRLRNSCCTYFYSVVREP